MTSRNPRWNGESFDFPVLPKNGDYIVFTYGEKELKFLFGDRKDDQNVSSIIVPIGNNLQISAQNFSGAINQSDLGVKAITQKIP